MMTALLPPLRLCLNPDLTDSRPKSSASFLPPATAGPLVINSILSNVIVPAIIIPHIISSHAGMPLTEQNVDNRFLLR